MWVLQCPRFAAQSISNCQTSILKCSPLLKKGRMSSFSSCSNQSLISSASYSLLPLFCVWINSAVAQTILQMHTFLCFLYSRFTAGKAFLCLRFIFIFSQCLEKEKVLSKIILKSRWFTNWLHQCVTRCFFTAITKLTKKNGSLRLQIGHISHQPSDHLNTHMASDLIFDLLGIKRSFSRFIWHWLWLFTTKKQISISRCATDIML